MGRDGFDHPYPPTTELDTSIPLREFTPRTSKQPRRAAGDPVLPWARQMETFDWDALETEELSQATQAAAVSPVASAAVTARSRSQSSTGSPAAAEEDVSFNSGDYPEEDVREWYVSYERVAVRASPQLEGEVLGVLARGRVLRGILYHWETLPWLKVKLEDVNGGPLAAQEWRVELPGAVLQPGGLHGAVAGEVKELPVGSLLYGRLSEDETAQLKTRQGQVNRYDRGKEVLKRLPDRLLGARGRFAWVLVEADHLGLGALLQPLVDHHDGIDGSHVADAPVQLHRVRDRGLGLFALRSFEQGECVLGDRPFFRRPSFAQLRQQKLFTKSFREKFEQIKAPFTRGDEAQSHIYASASMLRSAVSFCGASLMAQQMILELHHPPLTSEHPLVRVCGAVAKLCRAHLPACRDMQEELLQAVGFTPRMFEALILGDDRHMEALPSEHIATINRHVHGNHMAEHWCPVIVENELGQRWALHLDPLLVRQHRIKVRQELFDVQEKRARMLRRIKDIRATLPKADAAESRSCWEKEIHEAEQRKNEECLVRAFPNGVTHVTVFLEVSLQMVPFNQVFDPVHGHQFGKLVGHVSDGGGFQAG
eukprot:s636_g37.t1